MADFTVALNNEGQKVNIEHAQRRGKYTCINCGEQMMAKKGQQREWHFAHHTVTEHCNHDTWLHKNIIDLLISRLSESEQLIVEHPNANINLSDNVSFLREKAYDGFVPDILVELSSEVVFVEICVTNQCSKEKIASGHKIIEIVTSDSRVLEELNSGNICSKAQYYELKFYNFGVQSNKEVIEKLPRDIPDVLSAESDRKGSSPYGKSHKLQQSALQFVPAPRLQPEYYGYQKEEGFNGRHACFFVLHSDGTYEVKGVCAISQPDILVLGINTVADFAINIGKAYAWRKGLMDIASLTEYEQHIDLTAAIQSFHIVEFK